MKHIILFLTLFIIAIFILNNRDAVESFQLTTANFPSWLVVALGITLILAPLLYIIGRLIFGKPK